MKITGISFGARKFMGLIAAAMLGLFSSLTLFSRGHFSRGHLQMSAITVTNSSSREIRHLYLSPPDSDNWGPDQLHDSAIAAQGSFTIGSVSCDQGTVKI